MKTVRFREYWKKCRIRTSLTQKQMYYALTVPVSKCILTQREQGNQTEEEQYLLMDRAYENDKTRSLAVKNGFIPVIPPKKNRKEPWDYDKKLYKQRNEVERFFLRLKRFRKVFTRYDKLDRHFIISSIVIKSVWVFFISYSSNPKFLYSFHFKFL